MPAKSNRVFVTVIGPTPSAASRSFRLLSPKRGSTQHEDVFKFMHRA